MTGIFFQRSGNGAWWERNRQYVSRETCTNFLVSLITVFLPLYDLDRRFFEIDESMVKADLFVFGGGLASLLPMLNQVVDVEGLLDSKPFVIIEIIVFVLQAEKGCYTLQS